MLLMSHRFREINAVGTSADSTLRHRAASHRFREINAVGTLAPVMRCLDSAVASLPRDQRCWHSISPFAQAAVYTVASLPRDQRCWHTSSMGTQDVPFRSHRFREINAVGTGLQGPACVRAESHRFREINAVGTRRSSTGCSCAAVASLPRDQRCWHVLKESKNLGKVCRIASERSTLLAPIWRRSNRRFPRGRIASERSTLLALCLRIPRGPARTVASLPRDQRCWHITLPSLGLSRYRRIASERSTLLAHHGRRHAYIHVRVASLPRDQRCWH